MQNLMGKKNPNLSSEMPSLGFLHVYNKSSQELIPFKQLWMLNYPSSSFTVCLEDKSFVFICKSSILLFTGNKSHLINLHSWHLFDVFAALNTLFTKPLDFEKGKQENLSFQLRNGIKKERTFRTTDPSTINLSYFFFFKATNSAGAARPRSLKNP